MCRSIKKLYNFDPPATDQEITDASLQFVRKISGFTKPSMVNQIEFDRAVEDIADATKKLIDSLATVSTPLSREAVTRRARAVSAKRFGS